MCTIAVSYQRLVSELHRNSAYRARRAALVSASDTAGLTSKTPVLTQSRRIRNVRIAMFRAPTRAACNVFGKRPLGGIAIGATRFLGDRFGTFAALLAPSLAPRRAFADAGEVL